MAFVIYTLLFTIKSLKYCRSIDMIFSSYILEITFLIIIMDIIEILIK